MPLRRHRREYELLSQFERGRIIGMMETRWLAWRKAHHQGRSNITGTQKLFCNRTVIIHSQHGYNRTASTTFPPFPCLFDLQICSRSRISLIIQEGKLDSLRVGSKNVTKATAERDVARHHTGPAPQCPIVSHHVLVC
ncbi:hypothetical protein TNCV_2990091 [Trichonephila clavipes]|nr:hypothetical protein TNCV_2990091 [Trichonephila clavipes]